MHATSQATGFQKPTPHSLRACLSALTLLALVLGVTQSAQGHPAWERTFGGSDRDWGHSVQPTADGGYIIAGSTDSFGPGSSAVYLIKTDASGAQVWSRTFGGAGSDGGRSVQPTTDGGYIIAGWTTSAGAGGYDVYLLKTNAGGAEVWSRTFGGSKDEWGYSVQQTTDGGYIVVGYTYDYLLEWADVYLIKTDASGTEVWSRTFGDYGLDKGHSVRQTTDGGYIIAGTTGSFGAGPSDVYLIKTDASGTEEWSQNFGGASSDYGYSVRQTTDGGYVITGGRRLVTGANSDVYLIKTDAAGNPQWDPTGMKGRIFGGAGDDSGYSVRQTADGGYIIAGTARSFGTGEEDTYVIKTDAGGTEVWSRTFGGSRKKDYGESILETADGGYVIAGATSSFGAGSYDVYLIHYHYSECGDATLDPGEACDDGDLVSGDGCDNACQVEQCFVCAGQPSTCTCDVGTACGATCGGNLTCQDAAGVCTCAAP